MASTGSGSRGSNANRSGGGRRPSGKGTGSGRNAGGARSAPSARSTGGASSRGGNPPSRRETPIERALYEERDAEMTRSVLLILGMAVLAFLFLCNFQIMGKLGSAVSGFLFGVFGLPAYVFPIAAAAGGLYGHFARGRRGTNRQIWTGVMAFVLVGIVCDLAAGYAAEMIASEAPFKWSQMYGVCLEHRAGGGLIEGSVSFFLQHLLGKVGTILILIAGFAVTIVLFTERSLWGYLRSEGAYLREEREMRRQERETQEDRRREELAARRRERLEARSNRSEDGSEDGRIPEEERQLPAQTDSQNLPAETDDRTRRQQTSALTEAEKVRLRRQQAAEKAQERKEQREQKAQQKLQERQLRREEKEAGAILQVLEPPKHTQEMHELTLPEDEEIYAGNGEEGMDGYGQEPAPVPFRSSVLEEKIPVRNTHRVSLVGDQDMTELSVEDPDAGADLPAYPEMPPHKEPERPVAKPAAERVPEAAPARTPVPARPKSAAPAPAQEEKGTRSMKEYQFPPYSLLKAGKVRQGSHKKEIEETSRKLVETLESFGVGVTITDVSQGPTVTRYEMMPEQGIKVSKIVGLSDDIKLSLAAEDIRIEAPIPGKSAIGIEVPNSENSAVPLRDLIESNEFRTFDSTLAFAVGKDIAGKPVVSDIGKMPHVLIAGATGSGKSVCINTLIMSILYKARPEEVQMVLIDPKVVELSVYNGIPHLAMPVVTDARAASSTLQWAVSEMEARYRKFADAKVRDLKSYNEHLTKMRNAGEEAGPNLPKLVIIIDELADLMMVASKDVEDSICRLAQLARAAGIHLIVATQRPSVNVITGLIKANMPSRIAFAVSSGVDSRTILDSFGAEKLLGKGDMLFYPQGYTKPARLQGALVTDDEVGAVIDFLKAQHLHNEYAQEAQEAVKQVSESAASASSAGAGGDSSDGEDELFVEAGRAVVSSKKATIGYLQRMLKIGFNRAARIMDALADAEVVGPEQGTKPREVLMTEEEFESFLQSRG